MVTQIVIIGVKNKRMRVAAKGGVFEGRLQAASQEGRSSTSAVFSQNRLMAELRALQFHDFLGLCRDERIDCAFDLLQQALYILEAFLGLIFGELRLFFFVIDFLVGIAADV